MFVVCKFLKMLAKKEQKLIKVQSRALTMCNKRQQRLRHANCLWAAAAAATHHEQKEEPTWWSIKRRGARTGAGTEATWSRKFPRKLERKQDSPTAQCTSFPS